MAEPARDRRWASTDLPAAGPSLRQGFNGELPKGLVHSLRSLIDVGDSDGLPNGDFLGDAYSEARAIKEE